MRALKIRLCPNLLQPRNLLQSKISLLGGLPGKIRSSWVNKRIPLHQARELSIQSRSRLSLKTRLRLLKKKVTWVRMSLRHHRAQRKMGSSLLIQHQPAPKRSETRPSHRSEINVLIIDNNVLAFPFVSYKLQNIICILNRTFHSRINYILKCSLHVIINVNYFT
jgi:hypothetical protein